jgi:hypothetical protein
VNAQTVLELGVWKGAFAEHMLRQCPDIARYFMIDPWRHLDHWNKPGNFDQGKFDESYAEMLSRTDFARDRRTILRGKTVDVIDQIPDASLDLAYIDGDHTLRGITIDLIRTYPKVRPGGLVGGDDYTPTIWQHAEQYEPTLVCPFAAYFAEAVGAPIIVLPCSQFVIVKPDGGGSQHRVVDTTSRYGERTLLPQVRRRV